jgi:hypothetical protein
MERGLLPPDTLQTSLELSSHLCSEALIRYPCQGHPYNLLTDASLGEDHKPEVLGAIITQKNKNREY